MTNAQNQLNQLNKNQIIQINFKNQNLIGKIIIQDWPNLERIDLSNNKDLTGVELINLPNLKHFQTNNCQLENVVILNCPNINYFNVGNNLLTKTDFLINLNPQNLTYLSIHSNNFSKQKLDFLSQFINLEELYIDNSNEENFDQRIYNHFYGSLKPLQNLTKLKWLSIAKTDVDNGLEYLPTSVRKIGLKKDWGSDSDGNCVKIARELEKSSQIQGVSEELIKEEKEENEPITLRGKNTWYRLAPWRQACEILGEEEFKKQVSQQSAQLWLDKHYPRETNKEREKREEITFLNLNNRNLAGHLDLRDFSNLESLSCLGNKLTSLDLSNCGNLTKLNCSGNKFTNAEFLQELPNKEKLEILRINKNDELKKNLNFLVPFVGLRELNVEDCPLVGSLEVLKDMKNLKKVFISRTDISKGLEYLPKECKELYCDYDYQYKSIKIADELSKFTEDRHYNIPKWREDKQSNVTASVIPLERLFVVRSNIKKYVNKWGVKKDEELSEFSKLQSPEEFNKYWYVGSVKWIARSGAVVGGILSLNDYSTLGGSLAAVSPFVEILASMAEEKFYNAKEKKWEEFVNDSEIFLDSYHELLGILEQIKKSDLGIVNKVLNDLRTKVRKFLRKYDEDKNEMIDVSELIAKKQELAKDLNKQNLDEENICLEDIVLAVREVEKEVVAYWQGVSEENILQEENEENEFYQEVQVRME